MDKTEILARFDFYRRATQAQRAEFAAATESVRLPAGDAFYREGGAMAHVGLKCGRSGGSGTFTTEWRNVQTRVLGISP